MGTFLTNILIQMGITTIRNTIGNIIIFTNNTIFTLYLLLAVVLYFWNIHISTSTFIKIWINLNQDVNKSEVFSLKVWLMTPPWGWVESLDEPSSSQDLSRHLSSLQIVSTFFLTFFCILFRYFHFFSFLVFIWGTIFLLF